MLKYKTPNWRATVYMFETYTISSILPQANPMNSSGVRCLIIMTFRHQFIYSTLVQLYSDNVAYCMTSSPGYSIDIDQLLLFDIE